MKVKISYTFSMCDLVNINTHYLPWSFNIQDQAEQASEQPGLVEDAPAHCRWALKVPLSPNYSMILIRLPIILHVSSTDLVMSLSTICCYSRD